MDKNIDFGPKPFHCFDAWMEEKECEDIVKYCWEKNVFSINPYSRFRGKLKNVKEGLKALSKIKFGDLHEIKSLKNEATKWEVIAESRDLEEVELDRWKEARKGWVEKDKQRDVNEEEIWEAVKQCGSKKAPGHDGFNFGFLKKFWGIIKADVFPDFGIQDGEGGQASDPLSPFLYLVAAEGLNVTLKDVVRTGLYKGVKI
nr:transposon TX1 [Tanacetum cinerariifolium]